MVSKLSLHLQECPGWGHEFVRIAGPQYIKWIDPPEQDPFPGVRLIGRTFEPDEVSNARIWRGAVGAREWFDHWRAFYERRRYVWAWEGPNEPQPMGDKGFRTALDAFTVELARLMHTAGLRLVGHCWGVGWPDVNHAPGFRNSLDVIDYLGLHQYDAPTMNSHPAYYSLRHRRTISELKAANCRVPPILITECGIDGGVIARPKTGWRTFTDGNEGEYLRQLKAWSAELDKDLEVAAACIFTVCSWDWGDFNIPQGLGLKLAEFIGQGQPTPPLVPPPAPSGPTPDIQKAIGLLRQALAVLEG